MPAFDYWYVYETVARGFGIAAIPLNSHGHEEFLAIPMAPHAVGLACACIQPTSLSTPMAFGREPLSLPLARSHPHGTDLCACPIRQGPRLRQRPQLGERRPDACPARSRWPALRGRLHESRTFCEHTNSPRDVQRDTSKRVIKTSFEDQEKGEKRDT